MEIQNNKEQVPFEHYLARYRVLDPGETARRTGAEFDEQTGVFTLCLLGTTYRLHWPEYAIEADSDRALALGSLPCQTFLLRFLLEGSAAQPSNRFVTFREMPWGEMYIKPYTGRCLTRAAFSFGTRVAAFRAACEKMGALLYRQFCKRLCRRGPRGGGRPAHHRDQDADVKEYDFGTDL